MNPRRRTAAMVASALSATLILSSPAMAAQGEGGTGGSGGDGADTGSLYSDLVVAYRAEDGTPILAEYYVDTDDDAVPDTYEYCVQPVSYERVPGVTSDVNPLDGRDIWVIPLQGEWLVDPSTAPVEEIEACDPQPQYAMFVAETELERLNLTRTTEEVLARKIADVKTKLTLADEITLDPAGRIATDGSALDAAPEYAGIYQSLMTSGTIPGLPESMAGPPAAIPAGVAGTYGPYQLGAVAIGTAAGKYVPITVDTIEYYNRAVGFTTMNPLPSWSGMYPFIKSADPDTSTPIPTNVLPASEQFVDYSSFTYNRSETFVGSVTWLDVPNLKWVVSPILDTEVPIQDNVVKFTDMTKGPVEDRTLTGVTAFAQMADDVRSVIVFLHENEVVLPGFYMDPVGVDTTTAQTEATTTPAVDLSSLPADVFQTLPFQVTASLFNPWGGTEVDEGRVRLIIDAPTPLTTDHVTATTMVGDVPIPFDVNAAGDLVGWWGPDTGFPVPKGYHESTTFDVTVSDGAPVGDYGVTLELVDVDDLSSALATDTGTITVHGNALTLLWGGEVSPLATQGTFVPLPLRVYSPTATDVASPAELTFSLTDPPDDPSTTLVEALEQGDATLYGDNGSDMVAMPLTLDSDGNLVGTWSAVLTSGINDLTWYLNIAETAPVGAYVVDAGITDGTDLAAPLQFSLAAPAEHSKVPPDAGEDTTAPVVTLTVDGISSSTVSLTIALSEDVKSLRCRLTSGSVVGAWEVCTAGAKSYPNLLPGAYALSVEATDLAGNTATYVVPFTVPSAVTPPPAGDPPVTPPVTPPVVDPPVVDPPVVGPPNGDPVAIRARLAVLNNARGWDVVKVNAPSSAAGATVKLFKVRSDDSVVRPALAVKSTNAYGNVRFVIKDAARNRFTTYQAVVRPTEDTLKAWTTQLRIR